MNEIKEQTIKDLKRFIASHTSETGSVDCFDDGMPVTYYAERILKHLEDNDLRISKHISSEELLEEAEYELRCFLCREKYQDPNCECCGTCPGEPK